MNRTTLFALVGVAVGVGLALSKKEKPSIPQTGGDDTVKPKDRGRITRRVVPSR